MTDTTTPRTLEWIIAPYILSSTPTAIATLWKGAGTVFSFTVADTTSSQNCIAKVVTDAPSLRSDVIESYIVEQDFYNNGFPQRLGGRAEIPSCIIASDMGGGDAKRKGKVRTGKKGSSTSATQKGKKRKGGGTGSAVCQYLGTSPRFVSVLSNLSIDRPVTAIDLDFGQARASLLWMANFHSSFLGEVGRGWQKFPTPGRTEEALRGLWDVGGFWCLDRKADMVKVMEKVYSDELKARVLKENPDLVGVENLAKRLKKAARALRERLSGEHNPSAWFTLIHGDLKGENIALPEVCEEGSSASVYDFQWTGAALPVVDLAYFFASALDPSALERESELLDWYYQNLKRGAGKKKLFTRAEFQELFEVAFLDFMRWLCSYGLWGGPAEAWTLRRADGILKRWDGGNVIEEEMYREAIMNLSGKG